MFTTSKSEICSPFGSNRRFHSPEWVKVRNADLIFAMSSTEPARFIFVTKKGAVRALHTAFELLGNPVGSPRPPLQLLDGDDRKELDTLLSQSGFFN